MYSEYGPIASYAQNYEKGEGVHLRKSRVLSPLRKERSGLSAHWLANMEGV